MSFWSKLGKIGLMAAPLAAAPFTGGTSLALLGAGTGAASGAMGGGGLKGALLGGGLGAIPGLGKAGKLGGTLGKAFGGAAGSFGGDAVNGVEDSILGGGGGGISGFLQKLTKSGIDPTTLGLGAMSMLGGPTDNLKSNDKTAIDPVKRMSEALDALKMSAGNVASRGPAQLRSSFVPAPPAAINVPGVPFQIGGGLGRDPALDNPALLEGQAPMNPFQQTAQMRKPNGSAKV